MLKDCQKMAEIHSRDGQEPRLAKQNEREWDSRWRGQEERDNDWQGGPRHQPLLLRGWVEIRFWRANPTFRPSWAILRPKHWGKCQGQLRALQPLTALPDSWVIIVYMFVCKIGFCFSEGSLDPCRGGPGSELNSPSWGRLLPPWPVWLTFFCPRYLLDSWTVDRVVWSRRSLVLQNWPEKQRALVHHRPRHLWGELWAGTQALWEPWEKQTEILPRERCSCPRRAPFQCMW